MRTAVITARVDDETAGKIELTTPGAWLGIEMVTVVPAPSRTTAPMTTGPFESDTL